MRCHVKNSLHGHINFKPYYKKNIDSFMDNLIGMHNGTITSYMDKEKEFGTDSECIYYHLNQESLEDTLNRIQGYSDAYCLIWTDRRDNTLNFVRNDRTCSKKHCGLYPKIIDCSARFVRRFPNIFKHILTYWALRPFMNSYGPKREFVWEPLSPGQKPLWSP